MPKSLKISLLAVSVVLVLCVFLGMHAHGVRAAGDDQSQQGAYRQINVYSEVLQHIQTDYVEVPNIPDVTNGALRGLLESLDADSSYLTPADYAVYKASKPGKAQVGLNVSKRFGYATVVSTVPGSPADKAGLNDGDILEAIGNSEGKLIDTRNLSLATIKMMLDGAPGSELQIAVIRPRKQDPDKITMSRTVVSQAPVSEILYENASIEYLKPMVLDKEHVSQVEQKLKAADKSNKKVLLDLRDVAVGDPAEAVRLANFFLKTGTIATLEGQKFPKQTFTADASKALDPTAPLVVLVNRGTSGPAEIVAGAILDNKRGELVGERTFGEGSVQKTFELPDGGAIILSIAKYASPSGKEFEKEAVTPGTLVASSTLPNDDDEDEDAAPAPASTKKAAPATDDQLDKALSLLKAKTA
jgi:carboxyl-terminal processing protease